MSVRSVEWEERDQAETAEAWLKLQRLEESFDAKIIRIEFLDEEIRNSKLQEPEQSRHQKREWREKLTKRILRPPGFKLQAFADLFFSPKTYGNVLEPVLRDLQAEHMEALAEGRPRKARWVHIRGTWSFWAAVVAQLPVSLLKWIKAFVT